MKAFVKLAAFLCAAAAPASAQAEWREAETRNFIVYSEGSEQGLRDFATKLEKFDHVLRAYHGVKSPPSPIKLKVYLLSSIAAVGRMAGGAGVAGYYIPDSHGLMMVGTSSTTRNRGGDGRSARGNVELDAESILLHEYTHHFMFQYFPAAYPTWYSEGFAEFWGSINIHANDVVEIGLPANHRFGSFAYNRWLPLSRLLTARSYADVPEVDLLYAQGWLLLRHAFENPTRSKQVQQYIRAINDGKSYEQAMNEAFGDVGRYNDELLSYAGRRKFTVLRLPFKKIETGPIAVRTLRGAEDAMMEHRIKVSQGVLRREAAEIAAEVRAAAARFPDEPFALALLSETERLAGNHDRAAAAADKLLSRAPNNGPGLLQKGLSEIARLKAGSSRDAQAWAAARQHLVRAAKLLPNNPLALEGYYDSYAGQGTLPPEAAQAALYRAMELAPSDSDLRYRVASDFEQRDMIEEAISVIRPVAYELPHSESESRKRRREKLEERFREAGTQKRESAREMLIRLEAKRAGRKG